MAILVSEIKAAVKRRFNGIGDEDFLSLLRQGHLKICSRVQLYPQRTLLLEWTQTDVDNGVGEWPLTADVRRGWLARYFESATSSYPLQETNTHRLDQLDPEWRTASAGKPREWYESGGRIGFDRKPSTASSSGYPRVELYYTGADALVDDDVSALPPQVVSMDAWEFYIKWKYAEDRAPQEVAERFRYLHRAALKELSDDIGSINARDRRQVRPAVSTPINL